ncbi:helix-turn-helix domain-containing protein [Pseudonocardia pini]|uniref:helix-turn-helix domain-containing protein n=1 Tax=Pseudonocardia pini TaxID=2758030 RepID=UPI0015F10297|nr:helix-turn-helix domain-containing protein [Pseudonocardia pini]
MSPVRPSPAPLPRTFYDAREVAESIGVGYRQVIELVKRGEIPHRMFGRLIRIPAWWIDEEQARREAAA